VGLEVAIEMHRHTRECLDVASIEPLVEDLGQAGVEGGLQELEGGVASCVAGLGQHEELLHLLIEPILSV